MRLLRLANTTTRDSLSLTIVTTSASSQSVNGITGSENNSGEKKNHSSPNLLSPVPKEKNHLCMTISIISFLFLRRKDFITGSKSSKRCNERRPNVKNKKFMHGKIGKNVGYLLTESGPMTMERPSTTTTGSYG